MKLEKKYEKYEPYLLGFAYDYKANPKSLDILNVYLVLFYKNRLKIVKYFKHKGLYFDIKDLINYYDAKPINYWWDENLYNNNELVRKKVNNIRQK